MVKVSNLLQGVKNYLWRSLVWVSLMTGIEELVQQSRLDLVEYESSGSADGLCQTSSVSGGGPEVYEINPESDGIINKRPMVFIAGRSCLMFSV